LLHYAQERLGKGERRKKKDSVEEKRGEGRGRRRIWPFFGLFPERTGNEEASARKSALLARGKERKKGHPPVHDLDRSLPSA